MNLFHALAASLALLVRPATASTDSRDEFCRDLSALESHVVDGSLELNATNNLALTDSTTSCSCSAPDENDGSFGIDCYLVETYVEEGVEKYANFFEKMTFSPKDGEYSLSETSWGRDYDSFEQGEMIDVTREAYYLEDGAFVGCKANACTSCRVCENDPSTFALDCSVGQHHHAKECDQGYTGGFVNTFDFGTIAAEEGAGGTPPESTNGDDASDRDRDAFCRDLTALENHMLESFEKKKGLEFLSAYECGCEETGAGLLAVDCTMKGAEGYIVFESTERMVFEPIDGKYQLRETSWDFHDVFGSDDEEEESYVFEDGVLASCEAKFCASCEICDDGTSVEVDCTNRDVDFYSHGCDDGYAGSSSHTFDFMVIREISSGPTSEAGDYTSDLGSVGTAGAPNGALASCKMNRVTAAAVVVATCLLTLVV